ncbi:MAG: hypothetical protein ACU0BF_08485 [Paracoccaceae bacterium]
MSARSRRALLAGGVAAAMLAASGLRAGAPSGRIAIAADEATCARLIADATGARLTRLDRTGALLPSRARDWSCGPGARRWRLSVDEPAPWLPILRGAGLTARQDAGALHVDLPAPNADLPLMLALGPLLPGAGPYAATGRVLRARGDEAGVATVELLLIADPAARRAALRTGRADLALGIPSAHLLPEGARSGVVDGATWAAAARVAMPTVGLHPLIPRLSLA